MTSLQETEPGIAGALLVGMQRHVKLFCAEVHFLLLDSAGRYLFGSALILTGDRGYTFFGWLEV